MNDTPLTKAARSFREAKEQWAGDPEERKWSERRTALALDIYARRVASDRSVDHSRAARMLRMERQWSIAWTAADYAIDSARREEDAETGDRS